MHTGVWSGGGTPVSFAPLFDSHVVRCLLFSRPEPLNLASFASFSTVCTLLFVHQMQGEITRNQVLQAAIAFQFSSDVTLSLVPNDTGLTVPADGKGDHHEGDTKRLGTELPFLSGCFRVTLVCR